MMVKVYLLFVVLLGVQAQLIRPLIRPISRWTKWLDRDDPSGTGDWEFVNAFRPRPCFGRAYRMEVRMKCDPSVTIASVTERIHVGPDYGLVCQNRLQADRRCYDYFVHYILPRMSRRFDRDNPSGTGDWERKYLETGPAWKNGRFIYWYANDYNYGLVHERLELGPRYGLVCRKSLQPDRTCQDYEVRFLCPWFSLTSRANFAKADKALKRTNLT